MQQRTCQKENFTQQMKKRKKKSMKMSWSSKVTQFQHFFPFCQFYPLRFGFGQDQVILQNHDLISLGFVMCCKIFSNMSPHKGQFGIFNPCYPQKQTSRIKGIHQNHTQKIPVGGNSLSCVRPCSTQLCM